ncbi:B-cell receptor CD22-like [Chanodichthys erythropterus]|uniref:B-cell receptor CD22-like n=1 Tax=Chanodichthys erythropterus TaxID=933992 RepID=UPI00351DD6EA
MEAWDRRKDPDKIETQKKRELRLSYLQQTEPLQEKRLTSPHGVSRRTSPSQAQRMAPPLALVILLMIHRAHGQYSWYVRYSSSYICALKGSTVTMTCDYPSGYQITKVFWTKRNVIDSKCNIDPPDLSEDPKYSQKVNSCGYYQLCCTIGLSHVTLNDENEYYCRFITPIGITFGVPGVTIAVTDLQVESPERVTEGDSVRLTCKSSCTLTDRATFIWYRNSQLVTTGIIENQLDLWRVNRKDTGRYNCGVYGHSYRSPDVYLNVRYPAENPVISISPSGEIMEGDSVTLNCNSDSNPPAEISWIRGGTYLKIGQTYMISKISSDDSGEYKCKSRNQHGEKYSDAVTLNVMYPPKNVLVSISPSGEIVSGDSVTLSCSSDSNPPALNFRWFKRGTFVGSGRIYSISKISSDDSGEYKCRSINEHGEKYSDAVTLNVMYPPKSVSVSISPSGEIVSGDSVTLICSSDSNPPAEISWFKGGTFVGSGRIYSISKISSDDSGEYKCRSRNKHGEKYSDAVTLNIMYPPRSVYVSIIQSGQIWAGDSVTLICSSDSNPPALNFSWFKENESSAVGSGQSFSALQSGRFYCQAHNQHGSQRSDAVTVTVDVLEAGKMGKHKDLMEIDEGQIVMASSIMLVLIERCQNTQCLTVCYVWSCMAADQSGCPCYPCPPLKEPTVGLGPAIRVDVTLTCATYLSIIVDYWEDVASFSRIMLLPQSKNGLGMRVNPFGLSEVDCEKDFYKDILTDFTKSQQSGPWECISRHSCPLRTKSQLWCTEREANPHHTGMCICHDVSSSTWCKASPQISMNNLHDD